MKQLIAATVFLFVALPGWASEGIIKVKASGDVASTTDALEAAVTGAGATVFARIDHAGGAKNAGMELSDSQLLIFGNPKLGTPAMQDDPQAGLYLPLKVLIYKDASSDIWLAYEDPKEMLDDLPGINDDAEYIRKMSGALAKLTKKAAGM